MEQGCGRASAATRAQGERADTGLSAKRAAFLRFKTDHAGRCCDPDPKRIKPDSGNACMGTARRGALHKATPSGRGHPQDTGPVRAGAVRGRPTRRWARRDPRAQRGTRPPRPDPGDDCPGSSTRWSPVARVRNPPTPPGAAPCRVRAPQASLPFPARALATRKGADDVHWPAGTACARRRRASRPKRPVGTPLRADARGRCRS